RLFWHASLLAASRTFCTAGKSRPIKTAMMAIVTSNSTSVKPRRVPMGSLRLGTERAGRAFKPDADCPWLMKVGRSTSAWKGSPTFSCHGNVEGRFHAGTEPIRGPHGDLRRPALIGGVVQCQAIVVDRSRDQRLIVVGHHRVAQEFVAFDDRHVVD